MEPLDLLASLIGSMTARPAVNIEEATWIFGRIPGAMHAISQALDLTYRRGLYDGFVMGALLVLVPLAIFRRK